MLSNLVTRLQSQACHGKEKGAGRQMQCVAWTQVSLHSSAPNRISDLPRHSSPATRNPVKTTDRSFQPRFLLQEIIFAHSPHEEGLSQSAKPSGESSAQIRLALPARNCRNRMRDPPDSGTRCLSSEQRVRTSQIRRAPFGASVPAGPSASRRIQLAARSRDSVGQLRWLDRAACVACGEATLLSVNFALAIPSRIDDSPGIRIRLPTAPSALTDRDKYLPTELRRASAMALPRFGVSRYAAAWAESLEGAMSGHQS